MKIGIDTRTLADGKTTGVEVYTINLLKNIFSLDTENEYHVFFNSFRKGQDFTFGKDRQNVKNYFFTYPNKCLNFSMLFFNRPRIDRMLGGLDLFFSPRYLFSALSSNCPLITSVHDLSFLYRPDFFSKKQQFWHYLIGDKKICSRSKKIISVSNSTKEDLIKFFGVNPKKISVIYPGIDHLFFHPQRDHDAESQLRQKYNIFDNFILYLGTIEPRKNILGIVRAFEALRQNRIELKLVVAGKLGWRYKKVLKLIARSSVKNDIILLDSFAEEEKPHLYRMAKVFVFPSFYEGFGFPPLEAAACGTPVVAGMNSSLTEILGQAPVYVNPNNYSEIFSSIKNLVDDQNLYEQKMKQGIEQASQYSWEKSAKQTIEVFNSI